MRRARQCSGQADVSYAAFSGNFREEWNSSSALRVSYSGTGSVKLQPLDPIPPYMPETTAMTITAAHVPAIIALLAGILILIMPRFLNFVVAIYLIIIGLHGVGVFKWLKF